MSKLQLIGLPQTHPAFFKSFKPLSKKLIRFGTALQKLPLEDAFSAILAHSIDEINKIISDGFAVVKRTVPQNIISEIYNPRSVSAIVKDPLKWKGKNTATYDIIKHADIQEDPDVQKYCSPYKAEESSVIDGISHISQCMLAVRYSQMLGVASCYTALKHRENEMPHGVFASLPQPKVNYECHYPAYLNLDICKVENTLSLTPKENECIRESPPIKICDIYSGFAVCGASSESHSEL